MTKLNYILQGFGFRDTHDFLRSAFRHTFSANVDFPSIGGFEFDPFHWLYWIVLIAIIWQLVVSLLENLDSLGFRFAKVLLKIINKKFYKTFELDDECEPYRQLNNQDNGDNRPT